MKPFLTGAGSTGEVRGRTAHGALAALLCLAFVLGGSARGDVASLVVLRPAAVVCLGIALATLDCHCARRNALPLAIACAAAALPALQLVPLPPGTWHSLPDRDLIAQIDHAAGIASAWRPLSMTPPETMNALWAGLLPLAVIFLGVQLGRRQRTSLLVLPLALGGVSAVLGLGQLLGDPQGMLYFYDTTNNGSAVGLFANRNHQAAALACLLPLAFAAASLPPWAGRPLVRPAWRMPMAIALACLLLPLILVTGSRAGLIASGLALASIPLVLPATATVRTGKAGHWSRGWLALAAAIPTAVVAGAIWLGRDEALDRLLASEPLDDLRLQILPTLWELAARHWLFGTGLGSFERVYQVAEPASLLMPVYVNHAHNDWLELLITGGLPALFLLLAGLVVIIGRAWRVLRAGDVDPWQPLRRAGLACMLILALASVSDYPLRTPHLAALFALAVVWLFTPDLEADARSYLPLDLRRDRN